MPTPSLTMEDMHATAEKRGGKCLSETYKGINTHLRWVCSKGHEWLSRPGNIRQGRWCPECFGKSALPIEKMQKLANKRGGNCVSDFYKGSNTHIRWRCSKNHEWKATPSSIQQGSWCPECSGRLQFTIKDMQELAKSRGGKCLSEIYVNSYTPCLWQCHNGHQWTTKPNSIKQGNWCPHCASVAKLNIDEMHKVAEKYGGKCLSEIYVNKRTPILWRCIEGHEWQDIPGSVRQGKWCPECSGNKGERLTRVVLTLMFNVPFPKVRPVWLMANKGKLLELDGFAENLKIPIAFEYNGLQHYQQTWFHNAAGVEAQQKRDDLKRRLCYERGVRLIVVPQFKSFSNLSGCVDQIEAAVLFAGLKIPRRWKRPDNLNELLTELYSQNNTKSIRKLSDFKEKNEDEKTLFCYSSS